MRTTSALVWLSLAPLLHASIQLNTSINDVFSRGSNELAGSITWTVTNGDFREANFVEPIYIRVTLDHNATLAETLVNVNDHNLDHEPICLALRLESNAGVVTMGALERAVRIIRWVEGESAIWLSVEQSSELWLQGPTGLIGPSADFPVSWTIGVSARASDVMSDANPAFKRSNLPFNTREHYVFEGELDQAVSTLICVDLRQSNLLADGTDESLLNYDIIAFDYTAEITYGVYGPGADLGITFTNDFTIARGRSRACDVSLIRPKEDEGLGLLCVYRAATNGTTDEFVKLTQEVTLRLDCDVGGNVLSSQIVAGSYLALSTGARGAYGFDEVQNARFTNVLGYSEVANGFQSHGRSLWRDVNLFYNDIDRSLDHPVDLGISVCVFQHYQEPPAEALLDWRLVLFDTRSVLDDPPYDLPTQSRRCGPSVLELGGGVLSLGFYRECQGNPVSLFFPYVPILQGEGAFWVGLATVNPGQLALQLAAHGYDEDGMRFTVDLGELQPHQQKTWLLIENTPGLVTFNGAGVNNAGETLLMAPDSVDQTAADYGRTRSSMFVRGTFQTDFLDDVFRGDLDGHLLVGDPSNASVQGAYLPRNVDEEVPGQNADLPLWRTKAAPLRVIKGQKKSQPSHQ